MSEVVALVQVDEQQIVEGGSYDSADPRVTRNPQWFSHGEDVIDRTFEVSEPSPEPEPTPEPVEELQPEPAE